MTVQPDDSFGERVDEVKKVGGATAVVIAALSATGLNGILQALLAGKGELDADGATAIINAFLVTAPLAIAVAIVAFGLVRIEFTGQNSAQKILVFVAIALAIGEVLGAWIYSSVYGLQLEINDASLAAALAHAPKVWYLLIAAGVLWLLVGYYDFFGFNHFLIALAAGGFAAFAAHRLLPAGTLGTV